MGRCPRRRKVCESVGERRCDVAGSLVTFSSRLHRRLHTTWGGLWARQIFRHREMVFGLCRAARVSESDGATAQAVCRPCVSSHTDACSHLGAGGGCDRFCHREIVLGLCRWKRTVGESVGEQWCDGAGRVPTLCFQSHRCILACSHLGTGGGWDRFCHREMVLGVPVEAHRRRECRGAMARRRRPFEDLGFAHVYVMCVWVV